VAVDVAGDVKRARHGRRHGPARAERLAHGRRRAGRPHPAQRGRRHPRHSGQLGGRRGRSPDGNPVLHDYGDLLDGPATVTVGAEGYENVTLAGVDASVIAVPLRVLNPPAPAAAEVSGRLSDFDSLRVDGRLDGGLVMPSIDLGFLGTFRTERLFSRSQCWDPLTEGLAADLIDPLDLPGNLYIPAQRERLVLLPITGGRAPVRDRTRSPSVATRSSV
jgi:hypothetical protein